MIGTKKEKKRKGRGEKERKRNRRRRKEREKERESTTGNDPPRDDRLHNDPTGIVRKLIADKIERSQDGIKEKAVNCTISLRIYGLHRPGN